LADIEESAVGAANDSCRSAFVSRNCKCVTFGHLMMFQRHCAQINNHHHPHHEEHKDEDEDEAGGRGFGLAYF